MDIYISSFLIGIGLSMDAFSLALVYGTYGISCGKRLLLSFIVGIFHFFMPLFGVFFGSLLVRYFSSFLVGVIFVLIGIEMIFSIYSDREVKMINNLLGCFLFGFAVSVDSFTVGIGLSFITDNYFLFSFVFMVCSSFFTYIGLVFGDKLSDKFGKVAIYGGGVIMILYGIYSFFR